MFILKIKSNIYIFTVLFAVVFTCLFFCQTKNARATIATGTISSVVKDIGIGPDWLAISWTASTTASSTITMKVRTGTSSDMASATDWDSCSTVTNGTNISANNCVTDGERYIQYQAYLSVDYATTSEFVSPELFGVIIKYEAVGILVSSTYNTLADDTVINEVRWNESKPGNSDVLVQLRSSADGLSWSSWLGSDGTIDDYFTNPDGNESIPNALSDGTGEQYLQYRVIFDSNGSDLPGLTDITIDYSSDVPVITDVSPGYIYSTASGTVRLTITGSSFVSGATVSTISSGVTINGTNLSVSANEISFDFDASNAFGGYVDITVTNPNGAFGTLANDFYINKYVGTVVSKVIDIPNLYFNALSWSASTTATSSVSLKARTSATSDMSGATDWADCDALISGNDISANNCVTDTERYLQYQAELSAVYGTSSGWFTPELKEIIINYSHWAASGTLVSSPYDTGSVANALSKIFWTESAPVGTDVFFQIRTAPDVVGSPGAWSAWYGLYENNGYYRNLDGQGGIYLGQTDGVNDQWMQYRVRLESDGRFTPTMSDITIEYGDKQYSQTIINDNVIINDSMIFR